MENKSMKTLLKATALAGMMLTASAGAAIDDNTLQVTGTVTPASCLPALSNGGEVNFGNTISEKLTQKDNQLPPKTLTFTITCDHAAKVSLHMVDNNTVGHRLMVIKNAYHNDDDNNEAAYQFGIGKNSKGDAVGAYSVTIAGSPVVNGDATNVIVSAGGVWGYSQTHAFTNGTGVNALLSVAKPDGEIIPMAFKVLEMTLKINAAVASNTDVEMTDAIEFDGSSTIVMTYL
ncbi:DUF1120 domain-containing protein [Enterobacter sp.]|uniref:DUF1120 domain-containing protein n=1 Tax=Enterobacter sp. TaxID=42895 RepID=UPI00296FF2A1|nr:DUF1120 domain-containing protein [Enterobacter sp.]